MDVKSSRLSPLAKVFVPESIPDSVESVDEVSDFELDDDDADAILRLRIFITNVTLEPEAFKEESFLVIETLLEHLHHESPADVVQTVFESAVRVRKFRLQGADFLNMLNDAAEFNLISGLQDHVVAHMHTKLAELPGMVHTAGADERIRATIDFCAAYVQNMQMSMPAYGQKLYSSLAMMLSFKLKALVQSSEPVNQLCGREALKKCGSILKATGGINCEVILKGLY